MRDISELIESRPTRARGLKRSGSDFFPFLSRVAPHAGAWIETAGLPPLPMNRADVAPHAGAWIETPSSRRPERTNPGRAPRGRVD